MADVKKKENYFLSIFFIVSGILYIFIDYIYKTNGLDGFAVLFAGFAFLANQKQLNDKSLSWKTVEFAAIGLLLSLFIYGVTSGNWHQHLQAFVIIPISVLLVYIFYLRKK